MQNIRNDNENLYYIGNFDTFIKGNENIKYSETKGDYVKLKFVGNKIRFYTHVNAWRGKAKIYIDDIEVKIVDTYSQDEVANILAFESENLNYGNHSIKIEVLGEKNEKSNASKVAIYRFEIDDEKPNEEDSNTNLNLLELKAIIKELKSIIGE